MDSIDWKLVFWVVLFISVAGGIGFLIWNRKRPSNPNLSFEHPPKSKSGRDERQGRRNRSDGEQSANSG